MKRMAAGNWNRIGTPSRRFHRHRDVKKTYDPDSRLLDSVRKGGATTMTTFRDNPVSAPGKLSLAEILEILTAGGELPLKFSAYDGSTAGPDDADLGLDLLSRARHHLPGHRARGPGPGPRLRGRATWTCTGVHPGDPLRPAQGARPVAGASGGRRRREVLVDIVRSSSASSDLGRSRTAAAGGAAALAAHRRGAAAQQASATPRRSTTTTTCPTRSTSGCSARR